MRLPKFEIKRNVTGEYYFTLKAGNGEVIAMSESYKTLQGCKRGISSVRRNAIFAVTKDLT